MSWTCMKLAQRAYVSDGASTFSRADPGRLAPKGRGWSGRSRGRAGAGSPTADTAIAAVAITVAAALIAWERHHAGHLQACCQSHIRSR